MGKRQNMRGKRLLSILLVLCMILSIFPTSFNDVWAAGDKDISEMDALSALGIDTNSAPEGFNENDTSNPYGKDTVTINPVNELYVVGLDKNTSVLKSQVDGNIATAEVKIEDQILKGSLYGHEDRVSKDTQGIMNHKIDKTIASGETTANGKYVSIGTDNPKSYLQTDNYSVDTTINSGTTGEFSMAASKIVNGNFDGNKKAKSAQVALLYSGKLSENGGLYLRVGDVDTGEYGSEIQLVPTSKSIGNPSDKVQDVKEDFATDPYLMQNYLQITTGDYDGDGTDEIAVFIPEYGKSRIVVYKLKTTTGQGDKSYRNGSQWDVAWTYSLKENNYVSNMVSLVSGDFNQDGITDLGATWGYYYGPSNNNGSRAVVLFGSKGKMLQDSQEFNLKHGESEIVRASFAFGDLLGSGSKVLILGGQYDQDLKENIQSRYLALYSWNGKSFVANTSKNFELFAKDKDGNYVNGRMGLVNKDDKFYSTSLCPANLAVISQGLSESPYLYLDSLLIQYKDNDLVIGERLDIAEGNKDYFVEYGVVSGDLVGLGYDTAATMRQKMSSFEPVVSRDTTWNWYYKNWFYRWIGVKTWYPTDTTDKCSMFTPGKTSMVVVEYKKGYIKSNPVDSSTSIAMPNTDNDTSYMRYTGTHYFRYTDPEVLAVLASPPYFKDLLDRDDLSGNYAESTTSYSSTKGSGGGNTFNTTIEVGAYVSVEQEFSVFGVVVASAEAEAAITAGFTYETEKMSSLEQTISYTASAGEDMIAFYSVPLEIYEYTAYTLNEQGKYVEQKMTVNMPHTAAVQLLSLDAYENIAKDYEVLPQISGTVLTHKLGEPSSYPSNTNGYLKALSYNGDWSKVGYSSTGGGASIGQEISMSNENSTSYNISAKLETKVGAGAGGFKVGVTFGAEVGGGWVTTSTSGNSFSGEMQNMPIEAEEFGYGHSWKIFSYLYNDGKVSFPIVNYLVTDVVSPASLPLDFEQNVEKTSDKDIAFDWSYDKMVAGFQIYRYYEFPDGTGSYELKFVPMTDGVYNAQDGLYHFEFIDKNLSPYTEYKYQVQTVRSSVPNNSITSEVIVARTKTDRGYPKFSLNGLGEDGYLRIYPDSISTITAKIENAKDYPQGISYQWQKLIDGTWADIPGKATDKLTFASSGVSDETSYRCRINVIYYDDSQGNNYYISAYSNEFQTKYSKRTPMIVEDSFTATTYENDKGTKGVDIDLELISGNLNHYTAPKGNVTFTITGTDYIAEYTEDLKESKLPNADGKFTSKAKLKIAELPEGVYEVSAYYSGNRVFKSLTTTGNVTFLIGDSGYQLLLEKDSKPSVEYIYGDEIKPTLKYLTNSGGTTNIQTINDGVTYEIPGKTIVMDRGKFRTLDIGEYNIKAKLNDSEIVAQRDFLVLQRQISVEAIQEYDKVGKGEVESKLPILRIKSGTMAFEEKLADLNLKISASNTAGNPVTLDNSTEPGKYRIIGGTSESTLPIKYNNYKVTYIPGVYTIIGQTYKVDIYAEQYQNRDVGTITLSNSEDGLGAQFSAGTELLFYATPYKGYEVDSWSAVAGSGTVITLDPSQFNSTKTRLSLTMNAEKVTVTVKFKKSKTTLITAMEGLGTITCDSTAFISGGYVNSGANINFTATPEEGYTFKEWKVESNGVTLVKEGSLNEDGSNTLAHVMGSANTIVRAIFQRDSYTINLSDNLEAVYDYDSGDPAVGYIKKTVYDGAKIIGGTEVLVKVRAGYEAAADAVWMVNGKETALEPGVGGYKFKINGDTSVAVETIQLSCDITTVGENGKILVKINGKDATGLTDILGGSKVVFTAYPDHGYAFDSYTVTGTDKFTQDGITLTINELGSDVTVKANFIKSTDYKLTFDFGNRGSASYILYDAFGKEVKTNPTESGKAIDVCRGDSVKLSITPNSGYMVDKWIVNGVVNNIRDREYRFDNISKDINVKVETISQISYTVNYAVGDGNGSISSATTDGIGFETGFSDVGGNSTVVISSSPTAGNMVDHWTINGKTVLNEDGVKFIGKVLKIDSLTSLSTTVDIKVYFKGQIDHKINLSGTNANITHKYTPDDAIEREDIRDGGKAVFTITPDVGYRIVSADISQLGASEYTIVKNKDSDVDDYGTWTVTVNEVNKDLTLIAEAKKIHTIAIETVIGGSLSSKTSTIYSNKAVEGEKIEVYQDPEIDYTFNSWNVSGTGPVSVIGDVKDGFSFTMPDCDVTVSAEFKAISTVDISYAIYDKNMAEENGYDGMLSGQVTRDGVTNYTFKDKIDGNINLIKRGFSDDYVTWPMSTVTFTASPDMGYKVLKWTIDGKEYNSPMNLPIPTDSMNTLILNVEESTKDMEVMAQFEPIGEEISYGVDGTNGKFTSVINELTGNPFVSGNIVSNATNISCEVQPDEGYEVQAWMVNGNVVQEGSNNRYKYAADGVHGGSITVKFGRVPFIVEYHGENGNVISSQVESGKTVRGDTPVTFTAEANPGYKFDSYTVEGSKDYTQSGSSLTVNITENTVVIANFVSDENCIINYQVLGSNGSLGAIKDDASFANGGKGAARDLIKFKATPDSNYKVKSWTVDGIVIGSADNTFDLIVSKAIHEIKVEFERSHYIVDFSVSGSNGVITGESINTGDSLVKGSNVKLTATADSGYQVKLWNIDGLEIPGSGEKLTYELENLSKDINITVEFEKIPEYNITVKKTGTGEGTVKAYVNDIETPIVSGMLIVKNHDRVKFTVIPKDEYNTAEWTTNALKDFEISSMNILLKDVIADVDVTAFFKVAELITVKAAAVKASETDAGVNGSISARAGYDNELKTINPVDSTVSITKGKTVEFTANPASGYMVKEWIVNDKIVEQLSNKLTIVPESNTNVKVKFEPIVLYKISLGGENYTVADIVKNPDELGSEYNDSIRERGTLTFTLIPKAGYYFKELSISEINCLIRTISDEDITANIIKVVENEDHSYTISISNVTKDIEVKAKTVKPIVTIEEAQFGYISASYSYIDEMEKVQTIDINSGDSVPVGTKIKVQANAHNGYRLRSWGDFAGSKTINPIEIVVSIGDLVLSGKFEQISSGGGISGSSSIKPTEDKKETIFEIAMRTAKKNADGILEAKLELKDKNKEEEYEIIIPKTYFVKENKTLEIKTADGTVILPDDMFDKSPDEDVRISIKQVDSKELKLSPSIMEQIGDKPVLDIKLSIGGKTIKWENDKKEITVSIPYTLTEVEKSEPHKVIAIYIDDNGNIIPLTASNYDNKKGAIVFNTNHTSYYSIEYVDRNFKDIGNYTWAKESIEALAARGVIQGVSETEFAPQNNITRADFVLLITRFLGFKNSASTNFIDVKRDAYYHDAVSIAKELGVVSGTGDNMFHPEAFISREDMMVIIERSLKVANMNDKITGNSGKSLDKFIDKDNVSVYAKSSIDYLIKNGIIEGSGKNILPKSNAKRAEVSVVLYKLLRQIIK